MKNRRLSIPIYLNQRIVFDLLATVEGGFSQLQTVKSSEIDSQVSKKNALGEVGTKNVFAFLNLGIKGEIGKQDTVTSEKAVEEERVFTPAALFSRLRDNLIEQKLLTVLSDECSIDKIKTGDFIEFSGVIRKNPMVGYMEGIIQMLEVALLFTTGPGKQKPKAEQDIITQMKKFLSMLTQAGSLDLIANIVEKADIKAVLPVQLEYFSNESPAAIIDGQFVVLGKIVRYSNTESDDPISLLRGTPLAFLPEENLQQFIEAFKQISNSMNVGEEFTHSIKGPVLLVVPIAIYA